MTYDITKHSPKKHFLQKCDFLFVWNANLNIFKENFLFVIFSVENFKHMGLMTFATVLWMRFKSIYRYEF